MLPLKARRKGEECGVLTLGKTSSRTWSLQRMRARAGFPPVHGSTVSTHKSQAFPFSSQLAFVAQFLNSPFLTGFLPPGCQHCEEVAWAPSTPLHLGGHQPLAPILCRDNKLRQHPKLTLSKQERRGDLQELYFGTEKGENVDGDGCLCSQVAQARTCQRARTALTQKMPKSARGKGHGSN